jgi:hypothetical protein
VVDLTDTPAPSSPADPTGDRAIAATVPTVQVAEHLVALAAQLLPVDDAGLVWVGATAVEHVATSAVGDEVLRELLDLGDDVEPTLLHDVHEAVDPPPWVAPLHRRGLRSVMLSPLVVDERRHGWLHLWSRRPAAFSATDLVRAEVLATVSAAALAVSLDRDGLLRAVEARQVIGVATGVLSERYDLPTDRAFGVLVRYSQHLNVKLREVARTVVDTGDLPAGGPGA